MKYIKFSLLLVGCFLMLATSCKVNFLDKTPDRHLKENVVVRRSLDGDYTFLFDSEKDWMIYQTNEMPKDLDLNSNFSKIKGDSVVLGELDPNQRYYFAVVSQDGDSMVVSERRLPLEGSDNFRDLGGIPTKDGRFVRWGQIYRSGKLSEMTPNDLKYVSQLKLKSIVDLRNDVEIADDPDQIPEGAQWYHVPIGDKEGKTYRQMKKKVVFGGYRKAKAKKLFTDVMVMFADSAVDHFRPVFDLLLEMEPKTPMLFHCTGGKDRTGFTAALILSALNVDRKVIMEDYLMSNFYRYEGNKTRVKKARWMLDGETIEYAFLVQKEYLNAVFKMIDDKYGGTENYLKTKVGLSDADIDRLRARYTYDPVVLLERTSKEVPVSKLTSDKKNKKKNKKKNDE